MGLSGFSLMWSIITTFLSDMAFELAIWFIELKQQRLNIYRQMSFQIDHIWIACNLNLWRVCGKWGGGGGGELAVIYIWVIGKMK